MTLKSDAMWRSTRQWCESNPGLKAAIVMPNGAFVLEFRPVSPDQLRGTDYEAFDYDAHGATCWCNDCYSQRRVEEMRQEKDRS